MVDFVLDGKSLSDEDAFAERVLGLLDLDMDRLARAPGVPVEIAADLVVISPAMIPSEGTQELASMLGLEVDEFGWWVEQEGNLAPLETSQPGIFLAGTGIGTKDIPETVSQGSGAAGKVLSLLARESEE